MPNGGANFERLVARALGQYLLRAPKQDVVADRLNAIA
jgi:hypothetical protein